METITSDEGRAIDLNAEYRGVSTLQLMENAGRAVAEAVEGKSVAVLAGRGGNGGDGLAAARHLQDRDVEVYLMGSGRFSSEDAARNWEALEACPVQASVVRDSSELPERLECDAAVDALLGTGVRGELREPVKSAVELLNSSDCRVTSIDVPTGVDPDTGEGEGVDADEVLSLHAPKVGAPGRPVDIGVPAKAWTHVGPGDVRIAHRARRPGAHKGEHGEIGVVGGGPYTGAPALSASAALEAGADLVRVFVPEEVADVVAGYSPNLIVEGAPGEVLHPCAAELIRERMEGLDTCVVGPGLGSEEETREAVELLLDSDTPLVVDADGILPDMDVPEGSIVTPHAGEFRRLAGEEASRDLVEQEAERMGTTMLLKGHVDVISNGERTKLCDAGNPGMAIGGTGDILSGIAAALLAEADAFKAAAAAAFVNGWAGDAAREASGDFTALEMLRYVDVAGASRASPGESFG